MSSTSPTVHIVRTGTANLASVVAALSRCGVLPILTSSPQDILTAQALVLPGVGSFAAAMSELNLRSLAEPLRQRISASLPTLSICLGMQVLFESSEESPGVPGLSLVKGHIGRFTAGVRIPQLGWNRVTADPSCSLLTTGDAYYANSFRANTRPDGFSGAWTTHGEAFLAAMERGSILACQFHPELSGSWGAALINRWLARAGIPTTPSSVTSREPAPC